MGIIDNFWGETTLHGPNHAIAARKLIEKIFWFAIFAVGLILAVYQSIALLLSYINDSSNLVKVEKQVEPRLLADTHYFKVCPVHWIDRNKVFKAVNVEKRISYRNLLFALAVLPSVNDEVLSDMGKWDEISKEDRIWRLERCNKHQQGVLPAAQDLASEGAAGVSDTVSGLLRKKRGLLGGGGGGGGGSVVDSVSDTVSDTADTVVDTVEDTAGDVSNVVEGGVDTLEQAVSGAVGMVEDVSQDTLRVAQALVKGNFTGALDIILQGLLGSCDPDCSPFVTIDDWEAEAESFYGKTNGSYDTLTDFLASVTVDFNPLTGPGMRGEFLKWEITNGRMCQVTEIDSKDLFGNREPVNVPMSDDLDSLFRVGGGLPILNQAKVDILPYSTESSYDQESANSQSPGGVEVEKKPSFLDPLKLLDGMVGGMQSSLSVSISEMKKIVRSSSCMKINAALRAPEGYGRAQCLADCRKKHESVNGIPEGFKAVTANDRGDVLLDSRLAPVRFLDSSVDFTAASNCMEEQGCDLKHYCEEWSIDVHTTAGQERPEVGMGTCVMSQLSEALASLKVSMTVGTGYEVSFTRRLRPMDLLGIVGGLLGLYLGSSMISIIHAVVFWVKAAFTGCRSDKNKTDADDD